MKLTTQPYITLTPLRGIAALVIMLIFTWSNLFGTVKNGYEHEISQMRECLNNLTAILNENNKLSPFQTRKIETRIKLLVTDISYYELTEKLLDQFKTIAPTLYNEIDMLTDKKGRPVNVYVKFIPTDATEVKLWGTTYMSQSAKDKDTSCSQYGEFTVSVKVWMVNNALLVLAHELGHVKYQIPHLASYMEYYKKHYSSIMNQSNYMGHDADDLSGKSASSYEKIFRKEFASFLKMTTEKVESPLVLMKKIRKNFRDDKMYL